MLGSCPILYMGQMLLSHVAYHVVRWYTGGPLAGRRELKEGVHRHVHVCSDCGAVATHGCGG